MSDSNQNSTVLIVTEDVELLSSLLENNTTSFQFISRESIQSALEEPDLLSSNHIAIIDIDGLSGGTTEAIEQTLNIKKHDPTQIIMMVGEAEPLQDILQSNIQPLIYRAFNKPINPNQIFLAFGSASKTHEGLIERQAAGEDLLTVGPVENRASIESIAAQQKNKPVIYAGVGVLALGLVAWLLLGNTSDTTTQTNPTLITSTSAELDNSLANSNEDVSTINTLNQEAAKALLEGRQISPPDDNALYYYNQALTIDPYDLTAYEGKKSLVVDLKNSYTAMVENAEFDRALETIDALQTIEPLDTSNYELREDLELAIKKHVETITTTASDLEIKQTAAVLAEIDAQSKSSLTATAALNNEKLLLDNIDQALVNNNLIPPKAGNAYSIVSEALQKNTISKVNFEPRIAALSQKLLDSANNAFENEKLKETEKFASLVKQLDVDHENLAVLESKIKAQKTALATQELENLKSMDETKQAEPIQAKIIPAKVISRSSPRYPARALERDIEGWVSIGFKINTDGIPVDIEIFESEPSGTFEKASIAAIKQWRFSPAMNEQTQKPVISIVEATKLHFKIDR